MGSYLNPGNENFVIAQNGKIYVDKTELISYTNAVIQTPQRFVCVSRPRRFGKSMTADMLTAYYSRGCDSGELFQKYKISGKEEFSKYLNRYDVVFLNMQEFLSRSENMDEMISRIKKLVLRELKKTYPSVDYFDDTDLVQSMQDAYEESGCPFVVIIDEWDCVFRGYKQNKEAQEQYLDFLRDFLKKLPMHSRCFSCELIGKVLVLVLLCAFRHKLL